MSAEGVVLAQELGRRYGPLWAVRDVSLAIRHGETLGLVGKNGAGKSTFLKMVAGVETPTSGRLRLGAAPADADELAGAVALVPQELDDLPDLSVRENLGLAVGMPRRAGLVRWGRLDAQVRAVLDRVGLGDVSPKATQGSLSVAQRRLVMLGRALFRDAGVVLLDEPSEGLGQDEREVMFRIVGELRAAGVAIVYSSHRLREILSLCDRLAVLRDGRLVAARPRADVTYEALVRDIAGGAAAAAAAPAAEAPQAGDVLLELPQDVGLERVEVRRGEILGVAGLVGSGRTSLLRRLLAHGRADGAGYRVMLLPENRKEEGLFGGFTLKDNVTIATLERCRAASRVPVTAERREVAMTRHWMERLSIKASGPLARIETLSGGNQQKILLGRALAAEADLVILDEPTVGLDVNAKRELFAQLRQVAAEGMAVVVAESDFEELVGIADRIVIVNRGHVVERMPPGRHSEEAVLERCFAHYEH
jgi:ABC-type sugar transport system ATPase subunit